MLQLLYFDNINDTISIIYQFENNDITENDITDNDILKKIYEHNSDLIYFNDKSEKEIQNDNTIENNRSYIIKKKNKFLIIEKTKSTINRFIFSYNKITINYIGSYYLIKISNQQLINDCLYYFSNNIFDYNNIIKNEHICKYIKNIINVKNINHLLKFENLSTLYFDYTFNESIDILANLKKLSYIKFGYLFNKPINVLKDLKFLETIEFGMFYNNPIDDLAELPNIKYITLGSQFNYKIRKLPTSLKRLEINHFYHHIDELKELIENKYPYVELITKSL